MENIATESIKLINKKLAREINGDEYYIGLIELDKKFPNAGFYEVAQQYAHKNIKKGEVITMDFKKRAAGEREPGDEK